MQLRDPRFLELSYLLSNSDRDGKPLDVSFASTIELCRQLSFSFLRLHARGLCYRDISFGNVFFDPEQRQRADLRQRQRRGRQRHAAECSARRTSWRRRW